MSFAPPRQPWAQGSQATLRGVPSQADIKAAQAAAFTFAGAPCLPSYAKDRSYRAHAAASAAAGGPVRLGRPHMLQYDVHHTTTGKPEMFDAAVQRGAYDEGGRYAGTATFRSDALAEVPLSTNQALAVTAREQAAKFQAAAAASALAARAALTAAFATSPRSAGPMTRTVGRVAVSVQGEEADFAQTAAALAEGHGSVTSGAHGETRGRAARSGRLLAVSPTRRGARFRGGGMQAGGQPGLRAVHANLYVRQTGGRARSGMARCKSAYYEPTATRGLVAEAFATPYTYGNKVR